MKKKLLYYFLLIGILLSACTLPRKNPPDTQIATAAALTVQAALQTVTPLASPTAGAARSTAAIKTPTYTQPLASVGDVINCRSGPGANYERVTQILPSESVKIVGFFAPNYWVVSTEDGECWLSGEFTTPIGSFAAIPTVTAPPPPIGDIPKAATFPKNGWTFFCYGTGQADITLAWTDNADNEAGYRIMRNEKKVGELPANATYFAETIDLRSGESASYQIQAYNASGESSSPIAKITCP